MRARVLLSKEVRAALDAYAVAFAAYTREPTAANRIVVNESWSAARVVVLRNIRGIHLGQER